MSSSIVIVILVVLLLVVSWIAVVQYSRCSKLEKIANDTVTNMQIISNLITETSDTLNNEKLAIAFANDDDVGKFFSEIKEIQNILGNFIIVPDGKESVK